MAGRAPYAVWLAVTGIGLLAVLLGSARLLPEVGAAAGLPAWVPRAGAAAISTTYAFGLASRAGGRARVSGGLALVLTAAAVLSEHPVLVAGAAVSTAVLAGVLAVMATSPAARFAGVVRECLVAVAVAVVGAFAVAGYGAQVSVERAGYLALGVSLLGALGLVYRLGAGMHGLHRRGSIMLVGGVVLLATSLAYTEALARWGPPELVRGIAEAAGMIRSRLGAVPRPLDVFVGFPALAWGVSTRARSSQGWWVCAFAAPVLAVVALSLVDADRSPQEAGLSLLYGTALGLMLGYLVIRADRFLTGARGRRARRLEEASAHRPEPGRMRPLQ